ncbi:hypothetical protein KEM55_006789, partial [Ascosphaera atra]
RHAPPSSNPLAHLIASSRQSPNTPARTPRSRGNGLRSFTRKNYGAANVDIPSLILLKMRSAGDPNYLRIERIAPNNTACEAIIDNKWEGNYTRGVTWYDDEKTIGNSTQRAALVAQAAADPAPEPCTHCVNNGGVFDSCRVNSFWPSNGACASCAYWGHSKKHCSLADNSKTTRSQCDKVDKALDTFEKQQEEAKDTLARLREELWELDYINWPAAKKDPEGLRNQCMQVLDFFAVHADIVEKMDERRGKMVEMLRAARLEGDALAANPFAEKPRTEDEEEDEEFERQIATRSNKRKTPSKFRKTLANTPASQKKRKTTIALLSDSE